MKLSKKHQLKNYVRIFVLLLGVSVLLWNCEKEEGIIIEKTQTSKYKISTINSSQIQQNQNLVGKLKKIKENLSKAKKNNERGDIYSPANNFVINTEGAAYIESTDGTYHSYTFSVQRATDNRLIENLFLSLQPDGSYKTQLMSYYLSEQELDDLTHNVHVDLTDKLTLSTIENEDFILDLFNFNIEPSCADVSIGFCSQGNHSNGLKDGNPCPANSSYTVTICSGGGGGGNGDLDDDNKGGGGTGASAISTNPNVTTFYQASIDYVINYLYITLNLSIEQKSTLLELKTDRAYESIINRIKFLLIATNKSEAAINLSKAIASNLQTLSVETINNIFDFVAENSFSQEAINEAKSAIAILSINLTQDDSLINYEKAIKQIAKYLREFGDIEDEFFADYIESLIPDFMKMDHGEVFDIYKLAKAHKNEVPFKYAKAVLIPFAEAAYPFVVYAITEATLGAALPLLSRIPLAMVLRGARLNKMVKSIGLIGVKGSANNIRIVTTKAPISKAKELFKTLTKNAISKTTESGGLIKANMGNGNFITYRPLTSSSSGYPATISLDFRAAGIWTKIRNIKFKKP